VTGSDGAAGAVGCGAVGRMELRIGRAGGRPKVALSHNCVRRVAKDARSVTQPLGHILLLGEIAEPRDVRFERRLHGAGWAVTGCVPMMSRLAGHDVHFGLPFECSSLPRVPRLLFAR